MTDYMERYTFEAEWYDKVACTLKKFYFYYFPADNTIELFDTKTRKTFLKRTKCDGIDLKDIYIGATVTIFARSIKIMDYGDSTTKLNLQTKTQKTFGLIKPDAVDKLGEILTRIYSHDFYITNINMVNLTEDDVTELFKDKENIDLTAFLTYLTSGPVVALEVLGENGIARWLEFLGPNDSKEARETAPQTLRARYGIDSMRNVVYSCDNSEEIDKALDMFFPKKKPKRKPPKNSATLRNCTCCIIKPHAVQAKLAGSIIDDIQKAGYVISALKLFYVDPVNAEEFLEVYKGVLPDYESMVVELQSGACIAMEVKPKDEQLNVNVEFRKLCGPLDPEIAKQIRPNTLRAKYGKTRPQNAIHCSDLPEDGVLEAEYFFKILDDN
ncbi:nucleoside diphosphate kinase homolog 7 isoform X2 [Prorops nasuta]